MTGHSDPHPGLELLLKQYARELAETAPSTELDARIDRLVATHNHKAGPAPRSRPGGLGLYAAAAGLAALAIGVGIFIGMTLEHPRAASANLANVAASDWPLADLTMWPTDSVSLKIPAEYSAQGTLVAVDPHSKHTGTRYWIDVVVSNDGTFRIEQIVQADPAQNNGGRHGITPQVQ